MKTKLPQITLFTVSALFLAGPTVAATTDPAPLALGSSHVRTVTRDDYKDRGFDHLKGQAVRGADGKDLGHIRDLVLDARSGDIKFVVVGGGGLLGRGGDARLLPVEALIRDPDGKGFLTRLQRVDWELLPTLAKDDIKEGRLVLTSEQHRNIGQLRSQEWSHAFDAIADNDGRTSRYVFASALADKALYADDQKVGKVVDICTDLAARNAMAVVNIDGDYTAGTDHDYLVPIDGLQAPAGSEGRVHTQLAAADFQRAAGVTPDPEGRDAGPWAKTRRRDRTVLDTRRDVDTRRDMPATQVVTEREVRTETVPARVDRDRDVTRETAGAPTGYSSGHIEAELLSNAARQVKDAWAADPDLNQYSLQATPNGDRLTLSGHVPTAALAQRAEDAARHATTRIGFDNAIRVDDARR